MPARGGPLPFALKIAITNAWVSQLFDHELERRGTAPFQAGTLMMIARLQPVTPSGLQAAMGVPSTTLRNRVNELVAAGLVERVPNPGDGRSHLLRTTTAAQDVVKECKAAARQVQRQLAREGIDVSDGLTQGLDELRAVTIGLVNGYNAGGRGSLTTGPW
jgi:DNA-binding MarR family transcriptional regulator